MSSDHNIMIVAGEASGDMHAAELVTELKKIIGHEIEFWGSAGSKMRANGVEGVVAADEMSIVGLIEIGKALPVFLSAFRTLIREAKRRKPDCVILVDFPEFNLKLAKRLKKEGFRVVYYISPQLWAWRKYRISTIKASVDLLLTILPFEKQWYADRGVEHVEYVGNPTTDKVRPTISRDEFRKRLGISPDTKLIALLPGSRRTEISKIMPEMEAAARYMKDRDPELAFVVAIGEGRRSMISESVNEIASIVEGETYNALSASNAAAVTSGTATLETGIIGTPLVIVYKGSELNYRILRPLIDVEHFGLINLIAGKRLAKELIQGDLTPENLGGELLGLLQPESNREFRSELKAAVEKLGKNDASKHAAKVIMEFMQDS